MERTSSLQSRFYRNGTPSPGQGHVPYDWGFVGTGQPHQGRVTFLTIEILLEWSGIVLYNQDLIGTGHPHQGRATFPTIGVLSERDTLTRAGPRSLRLMSFRNGTLSPGQDRVLYRNKKPVQLALTNHGNANEDSTRKPFVAKDQPAALDLASFIAAPVSWDLAIALYPVELTHIYLAQPGNGLVKVP